MKEYLKTFANRESLVQAVKVATVGVFNTVATFIIFNCTYCNVIYSITI